jgi:hypothetical protein
MKGGQKFGSEKATMWLKWKVVLVMDRIWYKMQFIDFLPKNLKQLT